MTTFAATLKKEIARVARKELREDLDSLRKATAALRHEIATLKRELRTTQAQLRASRQASDKAVQRLSKAQPAQAASAAAEAAPQRGGRRASFNAERFKAQRERLGLTQKDMATYLGTSTLSVWKWESGQVTPRARYLPAILGLRTQGKREVLKALGQAQPS
jgi:DNA-binding transcriptional regulator YiaG